MYLNHFRYTSNGLGRSDETFQSLRFAYDKRSSVKMKTILLFIFLLSFTIHGYKAYTISAISLIVQDQRSLELFKLIKRPLCRVTSLHTEKNMLFCCKLFKTLAACIFVTWLLILILLSGDIQESPGPDSVSSLADRESDLSSCSTESLDHLFSIMHLNIQSIVPKLDLVETESLAYDIMVYSESWLKPTISNDSVTIANFHKPFRCDRDERLGGRVIIYVREFYYCKRRNDLEIINLEAVWVEVHIKNKTILVSGFYRPPNAKVEYYDLVSESVDRACSTQIKDIVY